MAEAPESDRICSRVRGFVGSFQMPNEGRKGREDVALLLLTLPSRNAQIFLKKISAFPDEMLRSCCWKEMSYLGT